MRPQHQLTASVRIATCHATRNLRRTTLQSERVALAAIVQRKTFAHSHVTANSSTWLWSRSHRQKHSLILTWPMTRSYAAGRSVFRQITNLSN